MTTPAAKGTDSYFTDSPSPPHLESIQQRVLEFAQLHKSAGRRIVLVTVRFVFIDVSPAHETFN